MENNIKNFHKRINIDGIMRCIGINEEDVLTILQKIEDKELNDDSDKTITTIAFCLFMWIQRINQIGGNLLFTEFINENATYDELRLTQAILLLVDMVLFTGHEYNDDIQLWLRPINNIKLFVKDMFNTIKDWEGRNNVLYNTFMVLEETIEIMERILSVEPDQIKLQ